MKEHDKTKADANQLKAGQYLGYVSGVGDAMGYVPAGLMVGQLVAVVSKYHKNRPEKWSEPAVDVVIKASQEGFPLKRPGR
jgi:hypothetical protein